jgi:voltage-gated sodium channel
MSDAEKNVAALAAAGSDWRARLYAWLETRQVQRAVILVIIINAAVLGLETVPDVNERFGTLLHQIDRFCLTIFVVELTLAMLAMRTRFFRDPWRIFDFLVVSIALVPATGAFSVLRSLRILRVLRLISAAPQMRSVVAALLSAIPGLSSIFFLLLLVFYVSAVMTTKLFGAFFPEWFGSIGSSMYTLFQIMTLESWSMGIVRPVLEQYPYAWLFFVPFIMMATFTMLNLFIAVIVNAMQSEATAAQAEQMEQVEAIAREAESALHADIGKLREEIRELKGILAQSGTAGRGNV